MFNEQQTEKERKKKEGTKTMKTIYVTEKTKQQLLLLQRFYKKKTMNDLIMKFIEDIDNVEKKNS